MSRDLKIRDRVFRGAVMAVVGAIVGLVFMLRIDMRRFDAADTFLLEAALIGAAVGGVVGFILSDYDWWGLIRRR